MSSRSSNRGPSTPWLLFAALFLTATACATDHAAQNAARETTHALADDPTVGNGAERGQEDGGPLRPGLGTETGFALDRGVVATVGNAFLENSSTRPILVESVTLVEPRGVALVHVAVHYLTPELLILGDKKWPPDGARLEPLPAWVAPCNPDENGTCTNGAHLLLGVRLDTDGLGSAEGVDVTYRSGDTVYTTRLPDSFALCGPEVRTPNGGCPDPAFDGTGSP